MDRVITFTVRLGLGLFLAVMLGLLGLALATLVIPPIKAGESGYLIVRVVMIGAGASTAAALAWSTWRDLPLETYVNLSLALVGGVGGALVSYTWVDAQFDGIHALDQALVSGRTTVVSAVVGANLLPALYSSVLLMRSFARKKL